MRATAAAAKCNIMAHVVFLLQWIWPSSPRVPLQLPVRIAEIFRLLVMCFADHAKATITTGEAGTTELAAVDLGERSVRIP